MSESHRAVFLSYASQDAGPAKRICEVLRTGGIEVWFDQSELRGGDAWDQRIREQIRDCALFVPVISVNTASRHEGYFRLEWDMADQRSHKIARNRPFIIPVCLDSTPDSGADVPESFLRVQWTRLPAGDTPPAFAKRIADLLSPAHVAGEAQTSPAGNTASLAPDRSMTVSPRSKSAAMLIALALLLLVGYIALDKWVFSKRAVTAQTPVAPESATAPSAIPAKSIAVLPLIDMSEKKDQEYFSDGLSEELIDLLAKTQGLEVIARTSSFYFKGKQATIAEIAKILNVANILEGSVRKSGNTIRVTAQLIRASDGVHIWSETYDRDLKDVFKVQDEIAQGVVDKLKLTLLPAGSVAATRTINAEAHSLYLQGRYFRDRDTRDDLVKADDFFRRALALDPTYAAAWAGIGSVVERQVANGNMTLALGIKGARAAGSKSLEFDPNNGEAYAVLGLGDVMAHEWAQADATLAKGRAADPTDPTLLMISAVLARELGREEQALRLFRQALERDPLRLLVRRYLARTLAFAGRLPEAEAEIRQVLDMNPGQTGAHYDLGRILLAKGEIDLAVAAFEAETDPSWRGFGLPLGYRAQHRTAEANAALANQLRDPHESEFQMAETYAYFGDVDNAFKWLDAAAERDLGIVWLRSNPLFKALKADPRYAALLRKLNLSE
jgi:TolB-like protein/tetratricopeptide (TPR) repeat protein